MGITDKLMDGFASKISGKKIQTVIVSFDEILNHLEKVLNEVDVEEICEIEKVIKGSFTTSLKMYDTKNEKYRIMTLYAGTMGSNRLTNEISIKDIESGNIYTYKVFLFKGKFKKAAKQLISKFKNRQEN